MEMLRAVYYSEEFIFESRTEENFVSGCEIHANIFQTFLTFIHNLRSTFFHKL